MQNGVILWLERMGLILVYGWLKLQNKGYRWLLRKEVIDPDSLPEIQELRKKQEEAFRKREQDEVVVTCAQCGQEYKFESLETLEEVSLDVRCGQCGCKYLRAVIEKLDAMVAEVERKAKAESKVKGRKTAMTHK